ncbi:MAG: NERD domain-containing protein [Parvibaculales bacterium]
MAFECHLEAQFSTPHENSFWNRFVEILEKNFQSSNERLFMIGNIFVSGKELDAIIIKDDAIIVVDFKNYGGALEISENAPWKITKNNRVATINEGRVNPYRQLHNYKFALLDKLKTHLPENYADWVNLGHINALVLFHEKIECDTNNLALTLGHGVSKWFNICDLSNVVRILGEITSGETHINDANLQHIAKALGINSQKNSGSVASPDAKPDIETTLEGVSDGWGAFAEKYYADAKNLSEIKVLIVGQDPYPKGGNGVAFCKNSHYELFQAGCSGGTVIKSLGLTEEMVRRDYKNPTVLFHDLLDSRGICFVNISHRRLNSLTVEEIEEAVALAKMFNLELVQRAKQVIVLGKRTNRYFSKFYEGFVPDEVLIHPSPKAGESNEAEWEATWATENSLAKFL